MTREQILALSGRELDAAVHLYVMNQPVYEGHSLDGTDRVLCYYSLPAYSTSWDAMGALIEHMQGKGWKWLRLTVSGVVAYAHLFQDPTLKEVSAEAPTAPEAVAKAALLAIGEG